MSSTPRNGSAPESGRPALRIVRGTPNAEELAALTATVAAAAVAESEPAAPPRRGRWNDPARSHVRPPLPGPGAWAASYR